MADIVVLRLATVAQVGSAIICYNIAIYEFLRLDSPWLKIVAKIENYSRATQHSHGYRPLFNCSFLSNTKHLLRGVILCHALFRVFLYLGRSISLPCRLFSIWQLISLSEKKWWN